MIKKPDRRYNFNRNWENRTQILAKYFAKNCSYIDFGAGTETVKKYLPSPKEYIPVDGYPVTKNTRVHNLNYDVPILDKKCDYIICQGLVEYLKDVPKFLKEIKPNADRLVITFYEGTKEKMNGWRSFYTFEQFENLLEEAGWKIRFRESLLHIKTNEKIYYCTKEKANEEPMPKLLKKKKILIVGASGYGNLGDDGYKYLFDKYLSKEFEVYFNSPYPDLKLVDECDYLVVGGGGLIYSNPKTAHFQYMQLYMDRAIQQGKPFSFISCGVQPTKVTVKQNHTIMIQEIAKEIAQWKPYIKNADIITVRSLTDKKVILALEPNARVKCAPDLCYLLKPVDYHLTASNSAIFILTKVSKRLNRKLFDMYWTTLAKKYNDNRYVVAFARDDEDITAWMSQEINPNGNAGQRINVTPTEAVSILKDAKEVVTARYHGRVFARCAGVPEENIYNIDPRYKSVCDKRPKNLEDAIFNIKLLIRAIHGEFNKRQKI